VIPLVAPALPDLPDNCLTRNEWICGLYYDTRSAELREALLQHIGIVLSSVALGLLVAIPLAFLARRYRRLEGIIVGTTTAIYTIPSLALFSLLVPVTGLGHRTVLIGLSMYTLTILVRAILDGLDAVPADVRESALGVGYDARRMLWRVDIPLALPAFVSGLRVATVSAVALTTVGAILDFGGLGELIIEDSTFKAQVLAGSVLCVALAVVLDLLLVLMQRLLTPWARRGARA
jgi:osmoprotectant transport system permease protein